MSLGSVIWNLWNAENQIFFIHNTHFASQFADPSNFLPTATARISTPFTSPTTSIFRKIFRNKSTCQKLRDIFDSVRSRDDVVTQV